MSCCCCRRHSGVSPCAGGRLGEVPEGSAVGEPELEANPRKQFRPAERGPPHTARATDPLVPSWLGGRGIGKCARQCGPPSSSPGRVGMQLVQCGGGNR